MRCHLSFTVSGTAALTVMWAFLVSFETVAIAEPPHASYLFPAGGQRGSQVVFRAGGHYLHQKAGFQVHGTGVHALETIRRIPTQWFEGPVIPLPASQAKEDYPVDYAGEITIEDDAPLGLREWSVYNAQGLSSRLPFVVGRFPEIVEQEIDGNPIPERVSLPVTINGRIFPREDVDLWQVELPVAATVTCSVLASQILSPLDPVIEVHGPNGERLPLTTRHLNGDVTVRFTTLEPGLHTVSLRDAAFGGLQDYVYRLLITDGPYVDFVSPRGGHSGETLQLHLQGANLKEPSIEIKIPEEAREIYWWHPDGLATMELGIPLEISSHRRIKKSRRENALKLDRASAQPLEPGVVVDGNIEVASAKDWYTFEAQKSAPLRLRTTATAVHSSLDAVLSIWDSEGKRLSQSDDENGSLDPQLIFQPPVDGTYFACIEDRVGNRGGIEFAYRLHCEQFDPTESPFSISFKDSVINLEQGREYKLQVNISRQNFVDPIQLLFHDLPEGITISGDTVGKNQTKTTLTLTADKSVPLGRHEVVLTGTATRDSQTWKVPAKAIPLSINIPTPFQFSGLFESKFAPRGTVHLRHYQLERNGYDGPIQVRLADRQVRHLQGVTGPVITLPAGATEFDYPAVLPPWLEVGRTSRTCLMAVGEVQLEDGSTATVTYTSQAQNDQIIVLTAPEILSIRSALTSIVARKGGTAELTLFVEAIPTLTQPISVMLHHPEHLPGVQAEPLTIPAGERTAQLKLKFQSDMTKPFNMPLTVRAVTKDERNLNVTAECQLEVVLIQDPDSSLSTRID